MGWKVVQERLSPRSSVAVRNTNGIAFGTLCWIEADRVMIELDGELAGGEVCELRVDVSPLRGTVLVRGRMVRQLVTGSDEMPRFVLRVIGVDAADIPTYDAWLSQIRSGGTLSDLSVLSSATSRVSGIGQRPPLPTPSAASPAAARPAPPRLDGHTRPVSGSSSYAAPSSTRVPPPAPSSAASSSVGTSSTSARDRLREALRGLARRPVVDAAE